MSIHLDSIAVQLRANAFSESINWVKNQIQHLPPGRERVTWISFLFQVQHYNADYEPSSARALGYPSPLHGRISVSGYYRTDPYQHVDPALRLLTRLFPGLDETRLKQLVLLHSKAGSLIASLLEVRAEFLSKHRLPVDVEPRANVYFELPFNEINSEIDLKPYFNLKLGGGPIRVIVVYVHDSLDISALEWYEVSKTKKGKFVQCQKNFKKFPQTGFLSQVRMAGGTHDRVSYNKLAAEIQLTARTFTDFFGLSTPDKPQIKSVILGKWCGPAENLSQFNHPGVKLMARGILFLGQMASKKSS
jgi:hypothetical protein